MIKQWDSAGRPSSLGLLFLSGGSYVNVCVTPLGFFFVCVEGDQGRLYITQCFEPSLLGVSKSLRD